MLESFGCCSILCSLAILGYLLRMHIMYFGTAHISSFIGLHLTYRKVTLTITATFAPKSWTCMMSADDGRPKFSYHQQMMQTQVLFVVLDRCFFSFLDHA